MKGTTCWRHWIQVEYDFMVLMVGCMVNPWLMHAPNLHLKIVRKLICWTWDSNPGPFPYTHASSPSELPCHSLHKMKQEYYIQKQVIIQEIKKMRAII